MSNCTIEGERPIHSHNYCINCNLYNSGDPTSCVSLRSLDNSVTCNYTYPGIEAVPASCKPLNSPNSPDYKGFDGTKDSCPEDNNYYFIPGTETSTIVRNESCDKIIDCSSYTSGDKYSCVSIQSDTERCIYINSGNSECIDSDNNPYDCEGDNCHHVCNPKNPDNDNIDAFFENNEVHLIVPSSVPAPHTPSNVNITLTPESEKNYEPKTCSEIYDYSLGYCNPTMCNYEPEKCPENEGYIYIYSTDAQSPPHDTNCVLKQKYN